MQRKLAQLLAAIDPSRVIDKTACRIDEAINTSSVRTSHVTDWDEFRRCIVEFGRHLDAKVFCVHLSPR